MSAPNFYIVADGNAYAVDDVMVAVVVPVNWMALSIGIVHMISIHVMKTLNMSLTCVNS